MKNDMTNPAAEPVADLPKGFPPELIPLYDWWKKEGRSTLAIIAVAIAVAGAVFGYRAWQQSRRAAVARCFAEARVLSDFESAVAEYGATETGPVLKLRLAKAAYDQGDFRVALNEYEKLSASAPDAIADIAKVGRAQALEGLGEFAAARDAFAAFAADGANAKSYLLLTARLGEARTIAEAGDKAAAVAKLEAMEKEFGDDPAQAAAKALVERTLDAVKRFDPAARPAALNAEDAGKAAAELEKPLADAPAAE